MTWKPIFYAPKDGTVIIGVHSDGSGVYLLRWGTYDCDETKEGWFNVDWSDEELEPAAFMECEQLPMWSIEKKGG